MTTEILSTHTPRLFGDAVHRAAELLRAGEVVSLPAETVYGLAANAFDERAVANIFKIKGRPAHNPIIVHVASLAMAQSAVTHWTELANRLAVAFWPGPLTLVLPRSARIPNIVTAGGPTVGLRWPAHPFMQAVIRECGFPLAAPSANLSNHISPTNAAHVSQQLDGCIPLIVDGGQSQVGIESTVLDLTVSPQRILRPGPIHAESLVAAGADVQFAEIISPGHEHAGAASSTLRSPGQLARHYAPKATLKVLQWTDDADLRSQIRQWPAPLNKVHIVVHSRVPAGFNPENVSVIPHDAEAFARALYGELHRCDAAGAELIVVEAPPQSSEWSGIADRLRRAAA